MASYLGRLDNDVVDQFERMRRQMDQLFGDWGAPAGIRAAAAGAFPPVNVGASAEQVDVYAFAPGIDPKGLDISLQQNVLTLAGERSTEVPEAAPCYRCERFGGGFRRVLTLPEDVDPERVEARYRDGLLHIRIQRREEVRPRRIEVK